MKLEVKIIPHKAMPCALKTFEINGLRAQLDDFGSCRDHNIANAEEYGCGNVYFVATKDKRRTAKACKKYKITIEEFNTICNMLKKALDVGPCGWCV